ncbi:polysaccharide biosynthesis/export family protein [Armatimonas sp.]|uniref:polysaccharide biosynthesis/export family protein n=1 Tax=Armatimonas sp. TaxID=1872638 RepID=UPI003753E0D6
MIFAKVLCGNVLALVVLGAVLPQSGWAHGSPTVTQEKLAEDYRINPGDVVSIIVINHPEFSLNGQVLPDGTFVFPILGKITAAGRTRDQIASEIAKGLKEKKQLTRPNVTVNVVQREPREITILGTVRGAGKLVLKENWTILDALGAAGGIASGSASATTRYEFYKADLFRDAKVIPLDLAKIYANDSAHNLLLKNGDMINVTVLDRNQITVTVIGEVGAGRGGTVELPKDGAILSLLNDLGGVTDKAALSKATILRKGKVLKVDLRGYKKGKIENDILLEGGDVLTIPKLEARYKINGAVGKQGEQDYPDDRTLTLFDALTIAGIPPTGADLKKVKLTRVEKGVSTTEEINIEKMLKGDRSRDKEIQPDDEIFVPATDPNKRKWGSTQDFLGLLGLLPSLYFIFRGRG